MSGTPYRGAARLQYGIQKKMNLALIISTTPVRMLFMRFPAAGWFETSQEAALQNADKCLHRACGQNAGVSPVEMLRRGGRRGIIEVY